MRFVSVAALTAASALLAACSTPATPTTRFVHDSVLVDYSPAANMGDVLDGWASCQKGSQRWSESTREDGAVVVRFECRAKDLLDLNQTIADKSKTIRRLRPLFEFADIRYRAEFLLNVDKNAFTIASQTNDYVWKDGKKASLDTEVLRLAYDGTLATDALTNLDSPEHYAFTIERYVQMLGPAYLELHGQP